MLFHKLRGYEKVPKIVVTIDPKHKCYDELRKRISARQMADNCQTYLALWEYIAKHFPVFVGKHAHWEYGGTDSLDIRLVEGLAKDSATKHKFVKWGS